jgi:hypothetical protein
MRYQFVIVLAIVLAGCATVAPEVEMTWLRTDGQSAAKNPALSQQFEIDKSICQGKTQQAAVGMVPVYYQGLAGAIQAAEISGQRQNALKDVAKGCMAEHGYVQVPADEAAERAAEFAKTAAEREKAEKKLGKRA